MKEAVFLNTFHGETWYECPCCKRQFEFFEAYYQRDGFKKIKVDIFVCPDCKQEFKIR